MIALDKKLNGREKGWRDLGKKAKSPWVRALTLARRSWKEVLQQGQTDRATWQMLRRGKSSLLLDTSMKPAAVKLENLRIVFDLPDEAQA